MGLQNMVFVNLFKTMQHTRNYLKKFYNHFLVGERIGFGRSENLLLRISDKAKVVQQEHIEITYTNPTS